MSHRTSTTEFVPGSRVFTASRTAALAPGNRVFTAYRAAALAPGNRVFTAYIAAAAATVWLCHDLSGGLPQRSGEHGNDVLFVSREGSNKLFLIGQFTVSVVTQAADTARSVTEIYGELEEPKCRVRLDGTHA